MKELFSICLAISLEKLIFQAVKKTAETLLLFVPRIVIVKENAKCQVRGDNKKEHGLKSKSMLFPFRYLPS